MANDEAPHSTPGLSSWGFGAASVALGVGAACTMLYSATQRTQRVLRARQRVAELLAGAVAGEEARVVITGATSGVGRELAAELARHPQVSLLLGCRDTVRAAALAVSIADASSGPAPQLARLDCLDLASVRSFAEEARIFLFQTDRAAGGGGEVGLRLLVNNAGVMHAPEEASVDQIDPTWQTNFLAPFLLTETLAASREPGSQPPLRVVNVSSRLEKRSKLKVEALRTVASPLSDKAAVALRAASAYSDSKRALMLWVAARAPTLCQEHNTWIFASTPGMVDTELGRHSLPLASVLWCVANAFNPEP